MFSALYEYRGTSSNDRVISFKVNDRFLEMGVSKDDNWLHVIDKNCKIGYVPKNYVAAEQPSPQEMLVVIEQFIGNLEQKASDNSGFLSRHQAEAHKRLEDLKIQWSSKMPLHPKKKQAPPPPMTPSISDGTLSKPAGNSEIEETTSFIGRGSSLGPEERTIHQVNGHATDSCIDENLVNLRELERRIAPGYSKKVIEKIRAETNSSFNTSVQAFEIVLDSLKETFPELNPFLENISSKGAVADQGSWSSSADGKVLLDIMEKLRECKDDQQQRSWALHEDKGIIKDLLLRLLEIVTDGDQEVCRPIMQIDDSRPLLTLVQYYQMETRWELRNIILQVFGVICESSKSNISYLSSSVLPLELAREILDEETPKEQIGYIVLVLRMILSMSDTLPSTHFNIMNSKFVRFILHWIESYAKDPDTDILADNLLALVLGFNLQFNVTFFADGRQNSETRRTEENLVIKAICEYEQFQTHFFEKLLLLFNREEDPSAMFDFEPTPPHSVMRMMHDVYQCPQTAKLIYTNDEKVVCDIILRRVTDLPVEDPKRNQYWAIFQGVIRNGSWSEHQHHREDFVKVATPEILRDLKRY